MQMSARRFPTLTRRSSEHNSSRLKPKSTLPDSPFLPKIGHDTNRSNTNRSITNSVPLEDESTEPKDPEQVWQRIHSKVGPITLPKVFKEVKQYEEELSEHQAALDALPQLNAEFVQSVDFFAKFLDDNNIKVEDLNDFAKFTRFCEVHGAFEKKQRLYYALMARRAVKLRQIDAVQQEMKTYQTAAQVLDTMTANTSSKKLSETQLSQEFSRIIEDYTGKSFQLCSLKSREEHVSTKYRLLKAKADRNSDKDAETHLLEEQRLQQSYIHVLDTSILKLFVNK